jgi:hypothetical protein
MNPITKATIATIARFELMPKGLQVIDRAITQSVAFHLT